METALNTPNLTLQQGHKRSRRQFVSIEVPIIRAFLLKKLIETSALALAGYIAYKCLKTAIDRRYKSYPNGPIPLIPFIGSGGTVMNEKFLMNACG